MENNQDQLRVAVLKRCMSQKEIAKEIGVSNIYLNTWLKGKRIIGKKTVVKMEAWLGK